MSLVYAYSKLRKEFGKQPLFSAPPPVMVDSIHPDKGLQKEYCLRNPVHESTEAGASQTEHDANTTRILMVHTGVEHAEGGWPREIRYDNEELRDRHVRRWQRDDGYVHAISSLSSTMEHCIHQNNAVSVYETYYEDLKPMPSVQKPEIHIRNVYRAGCEIPVSSLAWTNELNPKVVATHAYTEFKSAFKDCEVGYCCIWDIEKQIKPILKHRPQSAIWCVACSQRDPAIIVGGMYNGKVCEWDSRCGSLAHCTPAHEAHMDPVTAITYTNSRTHTEIFSGSTDGQCLRWDTRNLNQPAEKIIMDLSFKLEEPSLSQAEGITSLAFDKGFPTRLLVGLESGSIVNINRKGKTPQELFSSKWSAHDGKVRAVHRNPNFLKLFISCGDWSTKIFADDIRCAPIFSGNPADHFFTDVSWSSTRQLCPLRLTAWYNEHSNAFSLCSSLLTGLQGVPSKNTENNIFKQGRSFLRY